MRDQNSTELKIVARLVDEASAPIQALRGELAKFGSPARTALVNASTGATQLRKELELVAPAASQALVPIVPAAAKASNALGQISTSAAGVSQGLEQATAPLLLNLNNANSALGTLARGFSLFGVQGPAALASTGAEVSGLAGGLGAASAAALPLAAALAGVAAAIGGIVTVAKVLLSAARDASDFEEQFSRLPNVIKLTTQETEDLRAKAYQLSRQFDASEVQVAQAYYLALQEGAKSAAEATELVTAGLALQAAGVTDVGTAIRAIGDVLDAYGEKAGTFTEIGARLKAIALTSGSSFNEVAAALSAVGVSAEESGARLEQVGALFISLRDRGRTVAKATREITDVLQALTDPDIREKLESYGVVFRQVAVDGGGLFDLIGEIGTTIGTTRESLSKVGLERFSATIAEATTNSDKLAKSMESIRLSKDLNTDRLAASFATLARAGEDLRKTLVEAFGARINDSIARIVRTLTSNKPLMDALAVSIKLAGAALQALLSTLEILAVAANTFATNVAGSIEALLNGLTLLATFVPGIGPAIAESAEAGRSALKSLRDSVAGLSKDLQSLGGKVLSTDEIKSTTKEVDDLRASASKEISLAIRSQPLDDVIQRANELEDSLDKLADKAGLAKQRDFAFDALSEALYEASKNADALPDHIRAALDKVERFDRNNKNKPILISAEVKIERAQATRDLQEQVRAVIDGIDAPSIDIQFANPTAAAEVQAALAGLVEFEGSHQFLDIGKLRPERKAELGAWIKTLTEYRANLERVAEASNALTDGAATESEKNRARLAREISGYQKLIATFRALGLSTKQLETDLTAFVAKQTGDLDQSDREDLRKLAEEQLRALNESEKQEAQFKAAIAQSQAQVASALDSIDTGVSDTFAREKEALDKSLSKTFDAIVDAFLKAPALDTGALYDALAEFERRAKQARDNLESSQASKLLETSQRQILDIRAAQAALTDSTSQGLLAITGALERERVELERLSREGQITGQVAEQLAQAASDLAKQRLGGLLVDLSFRTHVEIDQQKFQRDLEQKTKPLVEETEQLLARFSRNEIDKGELAAGLDRIAEKVRALRLEAEQADGRFQAGFGAGLRDAVEALNDKFRNGVELARDYVSALTDNFANLIEKIALGKASFKDFANSLIADLIRITSRSLATDILGGVLGGLLSSGSGLPTGAPTAAENLFGFPAYKAMGGIVQGQMLEPRAFANGGIMPGQVYSLHSGISSAIQSHGGFLPGGFMPTRSYAMGGVATSPQMAIFAERPGMAEAFVPLPDGKRIPVALNDSRGGSGSGHTIHITINANAIDAQGMDQVLQERARTIGDIVAGQIASGENRSLRTTTRGRR